MIDDWKLNPFMAKPPSIEPLRTSKTPFTFLKFYDKNISIAYANLSEECQSGLSEQS